MGDVGRAHVVSADGMLRGGADDLRLLTALGRDLDAVRARAVVAAAHARHRLRAAGHVDADRWLATREAAEQASHPAVSQWRAQRFAGAEHVTDLCAGIGVDAAAIARSGTMVTAVELLAGRAVLARHNLGLVDDRASVLHGDALAQRPVGLVHADPARRDGERRLRTLRSYLPSVPALLAATRDADGLAIVVAPGIDARDPDLPRDAEVEYLQVGGDLVEAVVWCGDLRVPDVVATATLLPEGLTRSRTAAVDEVVIGAVGDWFGVPRPALVRARLHDELAVELGAWRVARCRALLTGDGPAPDSPWLEARTVLAVLPARAKTVRSWLADQEVLPLEILLHGVEADTAVWWRELGRPLRGPIGRRLHLVRTDDATIAVVTE